MHDTDSDKQQYHFLDYTLDMSTRCLYGPAGETIPLGSRALEILHLLILHRGKTLTKTYLVEKVWPNANVEENNLNQAITSIRKALGDSKKASRFIKTFTGRGYCFVPELDIPPPKSSAPYTPAQTRKFSNNNNFTFQKPLGIALLVLCGILSAALFFILPASKSSDSLVSAVTTSSQENTETIPNSIAVLPLTNLTPNAPPQNHIFSLGLHDELISQLSTVSNLNIVSRESVLTPTVKRLSIPEIGDLLRVESIITGTILFVDTQARINLQMLNPVTGVIKWTFAYEINTLSLEDMIQTQRDIALGVTDVLQTNFDAGAQTEIDSLPTNSFKAYRYNSAARLAYYAQDFAKAWTLSEKALALDPNYLDALYDFSKANIALAALPLPGKSIQGHLDLALNSAQRFIELAPEKHEGYVLEIVALGGKQQWQEAMLEVERLHEIGAPLWDLQLIVPVLLSLGDFEYSIEILEANLKMEPINSFGRGFLIEAYELVGDIAKAKQEYEVGDELDADWWGDVVNVFLSLGRNEPITSIDSLPGVPDHLKSILREINNGNISEIQAQLDVYLNDGSIAAPQVIYYAAIAAFIGENEHAVDLMQIAVDKMAINIHWFWLPVFQEARQLPEFQELLEELGLAQYWREYGWPEICGPIGDTFICD